RNDNVGKTIGVHITCRAHSSTQGPQTRRPLDEEPPDPIFQGIHRDWFFGHLAVHEQHRPFGGGKLRSPHQDVGKAISIHVSGSCHGLSAAPFIAFNDESSASRRQQAQVDRLTVTLSEHHVGSSRCSFARRQPITRSERPSPFTSCA